MEKKLDREISDHTKSSTLIVRPLFYGSQGTFILFCILLAAILVFVVLGIINQYTNQQVIAEETDPISGVTLIHTSQDPEESAPKITILGINLLKNHGVAVEYQMAIISFLRDYFAEAASEISYIKDSFQQDPDNIFKFYITIVVDKSAVYKVTTETSKMDLPDPVVSIEKEDYIWGS